MADMVDSSIRPRMKLRQWRLQRALSANELGKLAGVATSTITAIEQKDAVPRMETIRKLAQALGVGPQDIVWPGDPLGLLDRD